MVMHFRCAPFLYQILNSRSYYRLYSQLDRHLSQLGYSAVLWCERLIVFVSLPCHVCVHNEYSVVKAVLSVSVETGPLKVHGHQN